jgi:hypothetical protein
MTLDEEIDSLIIDDKSLSTEHVHSPSPFLPGTKIQYAFDSTTINDLKTCPRLYYYKHIEGWASKDESIHLRFGIEVHLALQQYDISRSNGIEHEDALHDVVRELMERTANWTVDESTKVGKYKNRSNLVGLVIDYLDAHVNDPAETYIMADGKPAVELSFQFELDWGPEASQIAHDVEVEYGERMTVLSTMEHAQPYILSGHLDKVVTLHGALLVKDYKTTTTATSSFYFNQFEPHTQMTLYTLAGKVVLNAPIRGVAIDALQILLEEPHRFTRGFTYRTPDQLDEFLNDLAILFRENEAYATQNYWPMRESGCSNYRSEAEGRTGCPFRDICSKSPSVRDRFLRADFIKLPEDQKWNPLKPR